jgi:hypothetical protein
VEIDGSSVLNAPEEFPAGWTLERVSQLTQHVVGDGDPQFCRATPQLAMNLFRYV